MNDTVLGEVRMPSVYWVRLFAKGIGQQCQSIQLIDGAYLLVEFSLRRLLYELCRSINYRKRKDVFETPGWIALCLKWITEHHHQRRITHNGLSTLLHRPWQQMVSNEQAARHRPQE